MPFDPHKHHRQSNRLENYDYSSSGGYFVTICTQIHGRNWFGEITSQGMQCNAAGNMIMDSWNALPERFNILLDEFIVMPDHVHGIIILPDLVGATLVVALQNNTDISRNPFLGDVVGGFKSITTNRYIKGVRELGWDSFEKRFWERDYYDHVVRGDAELLQIRKYILENPIRWQEKSGLV